MEGYTSRTFTRCVRCGADKRPTGSAYCPACASWYYKLHRRIKREHAEAIAGHSVCQICGRDFVPGLNGMASLAKNVDVDHAKETFRGVLCGRCNKAIGWFGDDPDLLEAAAIYLRRKQP